MSLPVPYFQDDAVTLYCGDAGVILPDVEGGSVDLIVTDPPYFRVKGDWWDRQWDSRAGFLGWLGGLCEQWRRVLRPSGSLYVFASPEMAWYVEGEVRRHFRVLNTIRWVKSEGWHCKTDTAELRSYLSPWEAVVFAEHDTDNGYCTSPLGQRIQHARQRAGLRGTDIDVRLGYVRTKDAARGTELCRRWEEGSSLPTSDDFARALQTCGDERGDDALRAEYDALRAEYDALRRPFAIGPRHHWSDLWHFAPVAARQGKHPCEKPLALLEHIVSVSTRPGGLILDVCAGSGTTLQAAQMLGRRAIGIEVSEAYCAMAAARLTQGVLPFGASA